MKIKVMLLLTFALSATLFVSCGITESNNKFQENTTTKDLAVSPIPTPEPIPEPTPIPLPVEIPNSSPHSGEENEPISDTCGVLSGELYYKDVEVALLFEYPFRDILGEPLDGRDGVFFFYDGLEIHALGGELDEILQRFEMAVQIQGTNLSLFYLNGICLHKTRDELIDMLGPPIDVPSMRPREYLILRYHIMLRELVFQIDFWFDYPDSVSRLFSLQRIFDTP